MVPQKLMFTALPSLFLWSHQAAGASRTKATHKAWEWERWLPGDPAMTRPFATQSRIYRSQTDLKERYARWEKEEKLLKYQVIESNRASNGGRPPSLVQHLGSLPSSKLTPLRRLYLTKPKWPSFLTILIGTRNDTFTIFFIREKKLLQLESFLAQASTNHFLVPTK